MDRRDRFGRACPRGEGYKLTLVHRHSKEFWRFYAWKCSVCLWTSTFYDSAEGARRNKPVHAVHDWSKIRKAHA